MSDFLPDDQPKKLPPMADEWFDGEKESTEINLQACKHELYAENSTTAKCRKCTACWTGANIAILVTASINA